MKEKVIDTSIYIHIAEYYTSLKRERSCHLITTVVDLNGESKVLGGSTNIQILEEDRSFLFMESVSKVPEWQVCEMNACSDLRSYTKAVGHRIVGY